MTVRAASLQLAEPPVRYLVRPPTVADCSVIAGLLFEEPWMAEADSRLGGRDLKAPCLIQSEIANVAVKKQRQGFAEVAALGLDRFAELEIELLPIEPAAVLDLAQRYQLTGYDASYLWLAGHLKCALATFDDRLAQAARAHLASLD
jgi:predicted nucleic acid-binding protein